MPLRWIALLSLLAAPVAAAPPEATAPSAPPPPPVLRLCTGAPGGTYQRVGKRIQELLAGKIAVEIVKTNGSWDNLEALHSPDGPCDAGLAQEDAQLLHAFERPAGAPAVDRVATLYSEHVHLVCNRAVSAQHVGELDPKKDQVLVAPYGSGTYITWSLFQKLAPELARLPFAEAPVAEALLKVVDGLTARCVLIVNKPNRGMVALAERGFGGKLKLLSVRHPQFHRKLQGLDRPVYRDVPLAQQLYPSMLTQDGVTQAVDAVFFLRPAWKAAHSEASAALTRALLKVVGEWGD
ncbi:MAG: hypothetical protein KC613_02905 [Myxococcales bacterium]|nr:hypothetical protein [Myxococcales bacterium]MCB9524753.1 hypothetical protein [Myxococcales bacterium]